MTSSRNSIQDPVARYSEGAMNILFRMIITLFYWPAIAIRRKADKRDQMAIDSLKSRAEVEILQMPSILKKDTPDPFEEQLHTEEYAHVKQALDKGLLLSLYIDSVIPKHVFIVVNQAFLKLPYDEKFIIVEGLLRKVGERSNLICINMERHQVILALKQHMFVKSMKRDPDNRVVIAKPAFHSRNARHVTASKDIGATRFVRRGY